MKSHPITSIIIVIAMLFLASCSDQTESERRASVLKKETEMVHIGVAWPFESANDLFWEGIELAVKEINESGGILNREVSIIKQDDEASVTKGLEIAQDFANNNQVSAVIGHRNSYVSLPASSIYERAGIVMLSPASSSPELTNEENEYIFRNVASDEKLATELANQAKKNRHKKMVIIYDDDAYGEGLANAFEKKARQRGIDVVDRITYLGDGTDLTYFKEKWKHLEYDGIFIAKSNPEGTQIVRSLRSSGIELPIYAGNAMDANELWNLPSDILEGITIGTFFNPESDRKKVIHFIESFNEQYDKMPSQYSAQGYDAVYLLKAAMEDAQSIVPLDIATSLKTLGEWEGVAGIHDIDENGDDIGTILVIKESHDGDIQYSSHSRILELYLE